MPQVVREAASQLGNLEGLTIVCKEGIGGFIELLPKLLSQADDLMNGNNNGRNNGGGGKGDNPDGSPSGGGDVKELIETAAPETDKTEKISTQAETSVGQTNIDIDAASLASALEGVAGNSLPAKLNTLINQGGMVLQNIAGAENLQNIVEIAQHVDQGKDLLGQVQETVDVISSDKSLFGKIKQILPMIENFAPSISQLTQ